MTGIKLVAVFITTALVSSIGIFIYFFHSLPPRYKADAKFEINWTPILEHRANPVTKIAISGLRSNLKEFMFADKTLMDVANNLPSGPDNPPALQDQVKSLKRYLSVESSREGDDRDEYTVSLRADNESVADASLNLFLKDTLIYANSSALLTQISQILGTAQNARNGDEKVEQLKQEQASQSAVDAQQTQADLATFKTVLEAASLLTNNHPAKIIGKPQILDMGGSLKTANVLIPVLFGIITGLFVAAAFYTWSRWQQSSAIARNSNLPNQIPPILD